LAVPDRVTALGGRRIVCGRALHNQSPNRRHSALEVPVPPAFAAKTHLFYQRGGGETAAVRAQNFFIVRCSTSV
jgi:hypothetical protein